MFAVLTERQLEVLKFIVDFMREYEIAPTLREIGDAIGIKSSNGVVDHLRALVRKGWISRLQRKSRGIVLTTVTQSVYGMGKSPSEDSQVLENIRSSIHKSLDIGFSLDFELGLRKCKTPTQGALLVLREMDKIVRGEKPDL